MEKFLLNIKNIKNPLIFILIVGFILRLIIAFSLYPGYDESYYYLYSKYLDWSYFDHPVFVALTTGLGVWLTGEVNQFTIRFGTLILHTFSLFFLYLTSKHLFNKSTALLTLIIASSVPIFQLAFGVFTLPDVPLVFFSTVTLFVAVKEFFPNQNTLDNLSDQKIKYIPSYKLSILGILIALACLSKYHGFILGIGIVSFCLTLKQYRIALISRWFWLGIILFLLTLFPLWYWNFNHDWISFKFQLSNRFQSDNASVAPPKSYNILNSLVVFISGIGFLFPTFGFPFWWISFNSLFAQFSQKNTLLINKYLLILWVSLPLTFGFTFLGGFTQILPTWPMPGFWCLSLILGNYAYYWYQKSPQLIKRCLYLSNLIIYTIILVGLLHMNFGLLQKPNQMPFFTGIVSPQNDPSTELIDTIQLGKNLQASVEFQKALHNSSFIFTNAYYLGGYISMAIAKFSDIPVTCFSNDKRGFNFWVSEKELIGKNGLYISSKRFENLSALVDRYKPYFDSFEEVTQISLKRSGEITEIFYIYQGINFLKVYP